MKPAQLLTIILFGLSLVGCDSNSNKPQQATKITREQAAEIARAKKFEEMTTAGENLANGTLSDWSDASAETREIASGALKGRFERTTPTEMEPHDLVDCVDEVAKEPSARSQTVQEIADACMLTYNGSH
jgi:hypothetical protein